MDRRPKNSNPDPIGATVLNPRSSQSRNQGIVKDKIGLTMEIQRKKLNEDILEAKQKESGKGGHTSEWQFATMI